MIAQGSNPTSTVSPWMFGGALVFAGLVLFSVPNEAVAPIAFIFIFGALLVSDRDAVSRGVRGPIEELMGQ